MAEKYSRSFHLDIKDILIAVLIGSASLFAFGRTLVPGLIPNDSSEFQALAYVMDHAHTTGYEVYTLLAKLFTLLVPVGDIAYRVNLFSAFCGAVTVGLVYLSGRVLSNSRWAGVIGSVVLAISATFWSQAIIAEVYTAGSMFTAAILFCVLAWYQGGSTKLLFAAGVLGGLSVGVHVSNTLFAPAILVLLLLRNQDFKNTWKSPFTGAMLGLALLVVSFAAVDYQEGNASIFHSAYLPSISRWDLQPEDVNSLPERFSFLVFARQWRTAMFADPLQVIPNNLGTFLVTLVKDFSVVTLLLLITGLVSLSTLDRRISIFFFMAILVHNSYTFNYRIGDIFVFFIPLYVYFGPLIAVGAAVPLRRAARWQKFSGSTAVIVLSIFLLVLTTAPFLAQRTEALRRGELRFDFMNLEPNAALADWHQRISNNVENLPENAIVLMDWHDLYGYAYIAHVELGRPNMQFIEAYPYSTKNRIADSLAKYLREKIAQGYPVYSLTRVDELQRFGLSISYRTVGFTRMNYIQLERE